MFNKLRLSDARPRTISLRRLRIASPAIDLHLLQTPPHDPSRQAEKKPPGDGATNGLPIDAEVAGNGGNRQALSMKIQNHHEFPEFDHRAAPSRQREQHRRVGRRRACQGSFWKARHYENWGIFKCHFWGELIRR